MIHKWISTSANQINSSILKSNNMLGMNLLNSHIEYHKCELCGATRKSSIEKRSILQMFFNQNNNVKYEFLQQSSYGVITGPTYWSSKEPDCLK